MRARKAKGRVSVDEEEEEKLNKGSKRDAPEKESVQEDGDTRVRASKDSDPKSRKEEGGWWDTYVLAVPTFLCTFTVYVATLPPSVHFLSLRFLPSVQGRHDFAG